MSPHYVILQLPLFATFFHENVHGFRSQKGAAQAARNNHLSFGRKANHRSLCFHIHAITPFVIKSKFIFTEVYSQGWPMKSSVVPPHSKTCSPERCGQNYLCALCVLCGKTFGPALFVQFVSLFPPFAPVQNPRPCNPCNPWPTFSSVLEFLLPIRTPHSAIRN